MNEMPRPNYVWYMVSLASGMRGLVVAAMTGNIIGGYDWKIR